MVEFHLISWRKKGVDTVGMFAFLGFNDALTFPLMRSDLPVPLLREVNPFDAFNRNIKFVASHRQ